MTKALIIAALVVAVAGAYIFIKRGQVLPSGSLATSTPSEIHVTTATLKESADTYTVDAQYPQFGDPAIDAEIKSLVELSVMAFKNDVAAGPPPPRSATKYEFISRYDSPYVGADVVSAKLVTSTYMGGAHGMSVVNGLNFDRKIGRRLTLDDALLMTGLTLSQVSERAKKELQDTLGADIIAPEGANPTSENYSTFIVDEGSVTFVFQVYQVAPYAAGPQEVSFERKQ